MCNHCTVEDNFLDLKIYQEMPSSLKTENHKYARLGVEVKESLIKSLQASLAGNIKHPVLEISQQATIYNAGNWEKLFFISYDD